MTAPNPAEKRKLRDGTYTSFEQMPRLVRDWAKDNGYNQINGSIVPPITDRKNEHPMEDQVRVSLNQNK